MPATELGEAEFMHEMFACADDRSRSELAGPATPRQDVPTDLRVGRLGPEHGDAVRARRDRLPVGCSHPALSPNPSLPNMRRMGIPELYERRNWIWRAQR